MPDRGRRRASPARASPRGSGTSSRRATSRPSRQRGPTRRPGSGRRARRSQRDPNASGVPAGNGGGRRRRNRRCRCAVGAWRRVVDSDSVIEDRSAEGVKCIEGWAQAADRRRDALPGTASDPRRHVRFGDGGRAMEFGVHLPQIPWDDDPVTLDGLITFATTAERLGIRDHHGERPPRVRAPVARRPDGARRGHGGRSHGPTDDQRLVARRPRTVRTRQEPWPPSTCFRAVVSTPVSAPARRRRTTRWWGCRSTSDGCASTRPSRRCARRGTWTAHRSSGVSTTRPDVALAPPPARPKGPPIWIGSWGSDAGLRRVARLGDGWLASGYNTTPEDFAKTRTCPRRDAGSGSVATRRRSRPPSRRPGCTSPTTRRRNTRSSRG